MLPPIPSSGGVNVEEKKFDQAKYIASFNKQKYDEIKVRLPKGSREVLKRVAAEKGYSLSGYITHLVRKDGVEIPE